MMSSNINVKLRSKVAAVLAVGGMLSTMTDAWAADPFLEVDGLLVIEAENYHSKANIGQRDWYTFPTSSATPKPDPDGPHSSGVGGGRYVEILPDSRVTHDDPQIPGVTFAATGANSPRLNYLIRINNPGRYYVRGRMFSTGLEDNGVHFGINGNWPLSSTSLQQCWPKDQWMWTGSRRTDANHCGEPNMFYLDLTAGNHTLMVAMREDGFEFDRFLLTRNSSYFPTGLGPAESPRTTGGGTPPQNAAPNVNAGTDKSISLSQTASLNGSASDDGLPSGSLTIRWREVSGPGTVTFGSVSSASTTARFSAVGSYVLELSATDGALTSTDRVNVNVTSGSGGTPDPTPGDDEVIALAATANSANVGRGNHDWVAVSMNGAPAMRALPNTGTSITSNYTSTSPYLRFNVNFPETGTYYVWLRGLATGGDNSAHVGLGGSAVSTAAYMFVPVTGNWEWSGSRAGGLRATINITSTGVKTVEVYMREDGFSLERIAFTKSSSYEPSGAVGGGGIVGSGNAFAQDSNGLVVMEAENNDASVDKGAHGWDPVSVSGTPAMEARPDNGARIDSGYTSTSPLVRFNVNFQKTGTHYVWLRGLATGNDNSAHVGLNGSAVATAANVTIPASGTWEWSNRNGTGQRITVNVTSTGVKTVEVYMREDGFALDRVLITTASSYSPSGAGPAQSPRQ